MKRLLPAGATMAFLALALSVLFSGCFKDDQGRVYTIMTPVYMSKTEALGNIKSSGPETLGAPGKIFVQGRYIFVNELDKGVHVIDNVDPAQPKPVAFINIPGNLDIAVKGTTLYADMYSDLVVVDITDPLQARFVKSVEDIFPERYYGHTIGDSSFIIVDWIEKDTIIYDETPMIALLDGNNFAVQAEAMQKGNYVPGIAGSMARFSLVNNYLYTINYSSLKSFDISDAQDPILKGDTYVGWNIETVYPFAEKLFIGSSSGMFIYHLEDPANPQPAGTFSHARACDPVITDGEHAFVTLRTGNACDGNSNQLDVLDVSDIYQPKLLMSYSLSNPAGLSKDGNMLFVCDGADGLKVYDATKVTDLKLLKHFEGMDAYDVIAWNGWLLLVAKDGLFQYDYTDPSRMRQLSVLHVNKTTD